MTPLDCRWGTAVEKVTCTGIARGSGGGQTTTAPPLEPPDALEPADPVVLLALPVPLVAPVALEPVEAVVLAPPELLVPLEPLVAVEAPDCPALVELVSLVETPTGLAPHAANEHPSARSAGRENIFRIISFSRARTAAITVTEA